MTFSVIMPVYNCAKYLSKSIDSVLAQTMADFELICIDDGSTDGSSEMLDARATEDSRICVIHQANQGVGAARNAGLKTARGEFVTFLDSDDIMYPWALETLVDIHRKYNAEMVRFESRRVNSQEEIISRGDIVEPFQLLMDKITVSPVEYSRLPTESISCRIAHAVSFCDLPIGEDSLFGLSCLKDSHKTMILNEPLVDYVQREGSATHNPCFRLYKSLIDYVCIATDICRSMQAWHQFKSAHAVFVHRFVFTVGLDCWNGLSQGDLELAHNYFFGRLLPLMTDSTLFSARQCARYGYLFSKREIVLIRLFCWLPYFVHAKIKGLVRQVPGMRGLVKLMRRLSGGN